MLGLMMEKPLLVGSLLEHAERFHPEQQVVSRLVSGEVVSHRYKELAQRTRQLANALLALGIGPGDRVATLAWNTHRHLELYYACAGIGAVCHTINPRLHPEQLSYIIEHAEDRLMFFDTDLSALVSKLAGARRGQMCWVALGHEADLNSAMPEGCLAYEPLLSAQGDELQWPQLDERAACSLCYTSGTTGNPKGVLYSHRSTVLHALISALPDSAALSAQSVVMPVVPMFHVNAWGMPYAALLTGAKLVMPGNGLDAPRLYQLLQQERVTLALGVPTIWQSVLNYLDEQQLRFTELREVFIGGAALDKTLLQRFEAIGVTVLQAWGMTELSPIGVVNRPLPDSASLGEAHFQQEKLKQGRGLWGVDLRIVNDDGQTLNWDGASAGHLQVRGHWVAGQYFKQAESACSADGWFVTGDIAHIDPRGFLKLTDRSKDVIKSGGEWISSLELELAAQSHAAVAQAAVIGIPDAKWSERPLLILTLKDGCELDPDSMRMHLQSQVPTWWLPERMEVIEQMPLGATGKVHKQSLRERFG
ncbi:fatty-acyl-CoA synthase [Pseudomonas cuatrocienegasensis]|uniref:Fatty-acyl-CoA synthase n=1 Tax=Pseudomonas cuatrocienegasensis TaxID=543360 RepID=A0ABY1BRI1_9PSED|nr:MULTISPECIES: long-chain fatty acid--CoA ligase [Pseudomonas]OEC32675.1 long-chain fatty acid--CoA ligase [Pseudomonas sp. 21C1]SER46050.1 fatty-acyl-CoA synthase [Pseudomonas cuatrocienegasensis]